jgi:multidrug efflux pump subunit AcrB
MDKREAIIRACRRRLRAVLLTAITTIVGLLPTAYGWGGLDHFVSSMALALSWGLIFATLITLVMLPALFMAGSDIFSLFFRLFHKRTAKKDLVDQET